MLTFFTIPIVSGMPYRKYEGFYSVTIRIWNIWKMPKTELIRVLAAVIEQNESYLICKRPDHKRHGGLWEFPGGKIEVGESDHDAAFRELREELGVTVTAVSDTVFKRQDEGSVFSIEFMSVEIDGKPQEIEHTAHSWVRAEDLLSFNLAPSDRIFVQILLGQV
jgi:8-oxo-dGTP diphosphatase